MLWLARVVTVLSMLWCDRAGKGRAWLWSFAFMGRQVRALARVSGHADVLPLSSGRRISGENLPKSFLCPPSVLPRGHWT